MAWSRSSSPTRTLKRGSDCCAHSGRRTSSSQPHGRCGLRREASTTLTLARSWARRWCWSADRSEPSEEGFYDDVVRCAGTTRIAERLADFEEMGLVGADYFVSAIGPAFEVFARYSQVVKLSGEEVGIPELMVLARQAVARHAMRRLLGAGLARRPGRGVACST